MDDAIVGVIPSMDIVFSATGVKPSLIRSNSRPIFHESYKRKKRIKRVLVLTNACNLQCSYCFEGTHSTQSFFSPEWASLNIAKMFDEAIESNNKLISFSLFGGEPSLNWDAVCAAITESKKLEKTTGIRCYKAIVTNGAMSKEKIKYLCDNVDFLYFSFDGAKELFLKQRKPKKGDSLYDIIFENAMLAYNTSVYLSFKVTVTKFTINNLNEIDDFFTVNFPTCSRLYQPCMVEKDDPLHIDFGEFLERFYQLEHHSLFPRNLTTSLYKNKPSDRFCNLAVRNVIYPNGDVLACHRSNMCIPDDKVREVFKVGYCDDNGNITKSKGKLDFMSRIKVANYSGCADCSLRYHCGGGCATIKLLSGNCDIFRKADYCEDFQRYAFSKIFNRLNIRDEKFLIKNIPQKIHFNTENIIDENAFFKIYKGNITSIEEN